MQNGEPGGSPFLLFRKPRQRRRQLQRRAPQKRCVNGFQFSRPGGVMLISPSRALATSISLLLPRDARCKEKFLAQQAFASHYFVSLCDAFSCFAPPLLL